MSTPVVVQGTPVQQQQQPAAQNPEYSSPPTYNNNNTASNAAPANDDVVQPHGGEKMETRCNDPIFAILFYCCIGAIVAVAAIYGPQAVDMSSNNSGVDYRNVVYYVVIVAVISFIMAAVALAIMMCIPETLIKVALIFSVIMSGVWCALAFASGQIGIGIFGVILFALSVCYACCVWSRIPFATVNLVTSITAIKANIGVSIYAYIITFMAMVWSFAWSIAFIGVFDKTYVCDPNGYCTDPNYGYLFLLFLAFFFGHQVFQYSVHVTVAGTVGTWWYEPDECGCCSSAINSSFIRTVTTSFGSICFGGFVVAFIQALRMLANAAQSNGDGNFLVCIAECLLACLASIVEYLNKWAFIYVGIYGFSYIKAAKSVFTLFKNRGWEAIIADDLVSNTLLLMSLVSGAVVGAIGLAVQASSKLITPEQTGGQDTNIFAFVLGFFVGLVLTSILMSVIGSGVNTVIVLFAEAPAEFERNYPELSRRMREVWNQIYPGSV